MKKTICLSLIFVCLIVNCEPDVCYILDTFDNGETQTYVCVKDEKTEMFCFEEYFENGILKDVYCTKEGEFEGERITYYHNGKINRVGSYEKGLRTGLVSKYHENGKIDCYNYCVNDESIYVETYHYDSIQVTKTQAFAAKVTLDKDTIQGNEKEISFEIELPIPDSLIGQETFIFKYDLKPLSFKDSLIVTPKYEAKVFFSKPFRGKIKLEKNESQIFYGYIHRGIINNKPKITSPIEIIVTVLN